MTRNAPDNSKALNEFLAAKAEIDATLERLQLLSEDHFGAEPDAVNWGHVGALGHYRDKLREIADMALGGTK